MAVPGLTHGWFGNNDGPLRPSNEFWRDVNRMHQVDKGAAEFKQYAAKLMAVRQS